MSSIQPTVIRPNSWTKETLIEVILLHWEIYFTFSPVSLSLANVLGMMQTGIKSENWTPLGLSNHPYHYGYEPSSVLPPSAQTPPTH